jgi:hypothetical protein
MSLDQERVVRIVSIDKSHSLRAEHGEYGLRYKNDIDELQENFLWIQIAFIQLDGAED